jgi:hypothetical protein
MKATELFVFLRNNPCFAIEIDLNYILSVLSIIDWININSSLLNTNAERNLEEMRSSKAVILVACLNMFNENFRRKENLTKLTLHRL